MFWYSHSKTNLLFVVIFAIIFNVMMVVTMILILSIIGKLVVVGVLIVAGVDIVLILIVPKRTEFILDHVEKRFHQRLVTFLNTPRVHDTVQLDQISGISDPISMPLDNFRRVRLGAAGESEYKEIISLLRNRLHVAEA